MSVSPHNRFRCLLSILAGLVLVALLAPGLNAEPKSKKPGKPKTTKSKVQPKPFQGGPAAMAERFHQAMSAHMQEAVSAARQAETEGRRAPLPFPPPFPFSPHPGIETRLYREPGTRYQERSPAPPVYRDDRPLPPYDDHYGWDREPTQFPDDSRYPHNDPYPYGDPDSGPFVERYEENPEGLRSGPRYAPPSRSTEPGRPPATSAPANPPRRREPPRDLPPRGPAPAPSEAMDLPYAKPVPGRDGYVTLDGYPAPIDVRGIAPGTAVEIPDPDNPNSTIQFRVP